VEKVSRATILISVLVYAILIGVNFDPAVRAKQVEAFGAQPLGLPVTVVVGLVETLLFLPIPWVLWHGMRIGFQAHQDGRRVGIGYMLIVGSLHPHLQRSQRICFAGLAYFFILCGVWIVYTVARGI
jgi:hypothetical protein